ncbi:MAG: hypothetical protein J6W52_08305 [Bacteroidaceae bacterium]|nr:hypothetical protein [Bacteroidaceae bacterium]
MGRYKTEMMYVEKRLRPVEEVVEDAYDTQDMYVMGYYIQHIQHHAMQTNDFTLKEEVDRIRQLHGLRPFTSSPTSTNNLPVPNNTPLTSDERIKRAIEIMRDEQAIRNSYDYAFIMMKMNETEDMPNFDSPNTFLTFLCDMGVGNLPGPDSLKKKISVTFGRHPSWTFKDSKGQDAMEAKRRNNVANRFVSIYRKGY